MIEQTEFSLRAYPRGIHLITAEVLKNIPPLPAKGLLNLLIKHTSAALALNENADPDVRHDLNAIFDRLVPENAPFYLHTDGRLNLGTWQGVYLCEFRDYGGPRKIVATVVG